MTLWTVGLLSPWNSPGKNTGLPFPSLGGLPDPGIKPGSPALQADSLLTELRGKPLSTSKLFTLYAKDSEWSGNSPFMLTLFS